MKVTTKSDNHIPCQQQKQTPQQSLWQKLVHGIVRPPRSTARDPFIAVKCFRMNETVYTRSDYTLNHQNKKIQLTIYDPQYKNGFIILYLHGNSSSKVQSHSIRQYLPYRYSMASFDFMGCGRNFQQDTITLGYRETQQVQTVVQFLKQKNYKIVIWGRSMGAATALRFGKAHVIVADSAFKSFRSLCKQFAKKNTPCYIPNCLISCLFPCVFCKIRADVQEKGNYDVQLLDIAQSVKSISLNIMLIFLSGDEDNLIDKRNSEKMYNLFAGSHKHLQIFKGNHNSKRPPEVLKRVMKIIQQFNQKQDQVFQKGETLDVITDQLQPRE